MDISQILKNATSPDMPTRNKASEQLIEAEKSNYTTFVGFLAQELFSETAVETCRATAALVLRNSIASRNAYKQQAQMKRWVGLDPALRQQIHTQLFKLLSASIERPYAAAVTASIAVAEISFGQWPECIPNLCQGIQSDLAVESKPPLVEVLNMVCQDLDSQFVEKTTSDKVLSALVYAMDEVHPIPLRRAATSALREVLSFIDSNLKVEAECNAIMITIFKSTQASDEIIASTAFEILSRIADDNYEILPPYIKTIYDLTVPVIERANVDDVIANQAIEFWCTLAEAELYLAQDPSQTNHRFCHASAPHIIPVILQTLTKQDEDCDADSWCTGMAGQVCLTLLAGCLGDDIVDLVTPFVVANIQHSEWKLREAAALAFGSIMKGPNPTKMKGLITEALPVILHLLVDAHANVRDTAGWTLGQICEYHASAIPQNLLMDLANALLSGLKEAPKVAVRICGAINNLAAGFANDRQILDPFAQTYLQALFETAVRPDADENPSGRSSLRVAAYVAFCEMIAQCPDSKIPILTPIITAVLQRLDAASKHPVTTQAEKTAKIEIVSQLCNVLFNIGRRMEESESSLLAVNADAIMTLMIRILSEKASEVQEDALTVVGAVANAAKEGFEKYLMHVADPLLEALNMTSAPSVCTVAVGTIGDIVLAVGVKSSAISDRIVQSLLRSLQDKTLPADVKPALLSCFGDLCTALGMHFERYLQDSLPMLQFAQASTMPPQVTTIDTGDFEFFNELRRGILEAFVALLICMDNSANFKTFLKSNANTMLDFISNIFGDDIARAEETDPEVICLCYAVLGDMIFCLGADMLPLLRARSGLKDLVNLASRHPDAKMRQDATHCLSAMTSIGF